MDLRISRGADIPVRESCENPPWNPSAQSSFPSLGDRKRSRPEYGHISSGCLHGKKKKKNTRDGLVNFQTKVWWSSFSSAARVQGTDSIYRTLIASNIYLLRPLVVTRYGRMPLIIARARKRVILPARVLRLALLIRATSLYLAMHAVCIHILRTQGPMMFTAEKAVSRPLQARGSSHSPPRARLIRPPRDVTVKILISRVPPIRRRARISGRLPASSGFTRRDLGVTQF